MMPNTPAELTERELLIAKRAAQMAVEEMTAQFYQQVGRTMVHRALVWIGALALGFGMAKGWITFGGPK
jgi:hypothetical protein